MDGKIEKYLDLYTSWHERGGHYTKRNETVRSRHQFSRSVLRQTAVRAGPTHAVMFLASGYD